MHLHPAICFREKDKNPSVWDRRKILRALASCTKWFVRDLHEVHGPDIATAIQFMPMLAVLNYVATVLFPQSYAIKLSNICAL